MSFNLEAQLSDLTHQLPNFNEASFSYMKEEELWLCQISFSMGNTIMGRGKSVEEAFYNSKTVAMGLLEIRERHPWLK